MFTEIVLPVHLCRVECLLWLLPARGLFSECLVEGFLVACLHTASL